MGVTKFETFKMKEGELGIKCLQDLLLSLWNSYPMERPIFLTKEYKKLKMSPKNLETYGNGYLTGKGFKSTTSLRIHRIQSRS